MAQDISSSHFPLGSVHVSLHHPLFGWKLKFYLWNEILVSTIKSHKKRPTSLPAMLKWCWVPCSTQTQTQNRWMVKTFGCEPLLVKREIFSSARTNSPCWGWIRGIALNDANDVVSSIFFPRCLTHNGKVPFRNAGVHSNLYFMPSSLLTMWLIFFGLRLVELLK